jgi:4-carboxymuconolactone decarboxylase
VDPFDAHSRVLELLGSGSSIRGKDTFRPIFPDLVDKVVGDIYGFAYTRPQLDIKTRQLLTLAVLSTMGDCEVQLKFHLQGALNLGLNVDEIREVFVQVAVLAGNVRAVNAAALFHEILAKAAQGSDGGATSHPPTHTASDKPAPAP